MIPKSRPLAGTTAQETLIIVFIMLVAAALRFYGLDRTSFWLDEAFSWQLSNLPFREMYTASVLDVHPPLHNTIGWFWVRLFGETEAALRFSSALFGTATVYVLFRVGRMLWNPGLGLTAAAILALSGFHIWYSQEFRTYALLALTAVLFMQSVLRLLVAPSPAAYRCNVLAGTLLLFSHAFGAFLFAGVNLFLFFAWLARADWQKIEIRSWLTGQAMAMAVFGPWALILLNQSTSIRIEWVPELTVPWFFDQITYLFNGPVATIALCSLALIAILAAVYKAFFKPLREAKSDAENWKIGLLLIWLLFPIFLAVLLSVLGRPLFVDRYFILTLPALCLLASKGLSTLSINRPVQVLAGIILVSGLINSTLIMHSREKAQYRIVTREVLLRYQPNDEVVIWRGWNAVVFRYYARNSGVEVKSIDEFENIRMLLPDKDRIWVILDYNSADSIPQLEPLVSDSHSVARVWSQKHWNLELYLLNRK